LSELIRNKVGPKRLIWFCVLPGCRLTSLIDQGIKG